jgi:hypothetical protein
MCQIRFVEGSQPGKRKKRRRRKGKRVDKSGPAETQ